MTALWNLPYLGLSKSLLRIQLYKNIDLAKETYTKQSSFISGSSKNLKKKDKKVHVCLIGFHPKVEKPLQGMKLQEKGAQKD